MTGLWIAGGLIAAAFASPVYVLLMWWLQRWQRVYVFALVGALLLGWCFKIWNESVQDLKPLFLLALTLSWFVCGSLHAVILLCGGRGPQHAPQTAPAQD